MHTRKWTGRFTVCAKARADGTTSQQANDYTGARTVVRSWRVRRRAVAAAMACARHDLRVRIVSIINTTHFPLDTYLLGLFLLAY